MWSMRFFPGLTVLVAALAPAAAFGQPRPPPPAAAGTPRRVAVIVSRTGTVSPAAADAATEALVEALGQRGGYEIIGKEEFQAQLGQNEEQSLQCIDSPVCLGRVGVQLNVSEVIAGTIGQRGPASWVYNVN